MEIQTKIFFSKQHNHLIDYTSNMLFLGSCFVENIGEKLEYFKFSNLINPLGILFHPVAIEKLIENVINEKEYLEEDIFYHNERWHCFDAHSKLSSTSKAEFLRDLNQSIKSTNKQIDNSTHIVITLGTAWVYRLIKTNTIVANCHKVNQKEFSKELLSINDIATSLQSTIDLIKQRNKEATVLFTVSPIRHLKNGFVENTLSKSHLIAAVHQIINEELNAYYFPSYEIIMDELRDYRFYTDDMIHPSKLAIDYIWEKFQQVWISTQAHKIMDEVDHVQKGMQHKAFNLDSDAHQKFLQNLEVKKSQLKSQFPQITF